MSHNTPSDYASANRLIKEIFDGQRDRNYILNHGKMIDVLQSRITELNERGKKYRKSGNKLLAAYCADKIHGIIECTQILSGVWEVKEEK